MVEKVTLLRDLPEHAKGYSFYLKGDKVSFDEGKTWHMIFNNDERVIKLRGKDDWVKFEKSDIKDDRPHLSEIVDMKLYNADEIFKILNWKRDGEVVSCCGTPVTTNGFMGYAYCEKCKKRIQDMTGIIPSSKVTASAIDTDRYQIDDNRFWAIVFNGKEYLNGFEGVKK